MEKDIGAYFGLLVIALGLLTIWLYRRGTPYKMLYHETGMPHLVGIVNAVHYETKRFKKLEDAIFETKILLAKGYHVVLVNYEPDKGRSIFMISRNYMQPFVEVSIKGTFISRSQLLEILPSSLNAITTNSTES